MTIHKITDVVVTVNGKELLAKVDENTGIVEVPKTVAHGQVVVVSYTREPVATYIGDRGYGKKKAQWKQEQRRFRK